MAATRRKSGSRSSPEGDGDPAPGNVVFTIDDLVAYLKLPKSTIYKLAQEGKIPGQKVGRHWRFHRSVIDRWLGAVTDDPWTRSAE
ncbi:MAG TPA: helix-turn-helix domain-containing protein [Phycisphaerales bacterium]|nr:helix-turn-helix domain-containing protein [Phycisphaerales bacterium]HMP38639.1 helix-turn-helix domain-containing protein [Phycisphaerales bacterium]